MVDKIFAIISVLLLLTFYFYFIYAYNQRRLTKEFQKRFFRAVYTVITNTHDIVDSIEQIEISYKKIREKNPSYLKEIQNTQSFLEEMLYFSDSLNNDEFVKRFDISITPELRNKVIAIINEIKKNNPFSSLSRDHASLLGDLKTSIDIGNKELGLRSLTLLSEEMKIIESDSRVQQKKNNVSLIIAIVGVILTIFFGIISLVTIFR